MVVPVVPFLRWAQKNTAILRWADGIIGVVALCAAIWQQSGIGIAVGVIFILAAVFNLNKRFHFILPRIQTPHSASRPIKRPHRDD